MNKMDTVRQLPGSATPAIQQMLALQEVIGHLDRNLAIALNRLESQNDVLGENLEPLLELRDTVTESLHEAVALLQSLTKSAQQTRSAMGDTLSALQEAAASLAADSARNHLGWRVLGRYVLVSVLSAGLSVALLRGSMGSELMIAAASMPAPQVTLNTEILARQIAEQWAGMQRRTTR
jgi:hypothetical protein